MCRLAPLPLQPIAEQLAVELIATETSDPSAAP